MPLGRDEAAAVVGGVAAFEAAWSLALALGTVAVGMAVAAGMAAVALLADAPDRRFAVTGVVGVGGIMRWLGC